MDDPFKGRMDLLRGGGGGIVFGADGCGSESLAGTGIGAGVCRGIVARDDETSSSAWPRVIIVNSA